MQTIEMPYGDGFLSASLPDDVLIQQIDAPASVVSQSLDSLLESAMDHPVESQPLDALVKPDDTVVIVVNDHTRPGPNDKIVSAISRCLAAAGVPDDHVTILFATGSHRSPTEEEKRKIVGEDAYRRFRLVAHDCLDDANMAYIGDTDTGMPIYVNRLVTECSFLVTTGLIAPIHTAGYSGGRKSIVPGVAGLKTLHVHHSFPIYQYEPAMGFIYGNPFHEIALAAAKKAGVKFMVNAVQAPDKQFIGFVAGDLAAAHAVGVELCRKASTVEIPHRADVVIASPGGFPRDIDLYQSQKALSVAEVIGKQPCAFIIVAECRDGFGEETFRKWMIACASPDEIIRRYGEEGFNVGNNKAFNYARALKKGRVIIVTDRIPAEELRRAKLESAPTLQAAMDMCLAKGGGQIVSVLEHASNIIPKIMES